MRHIRHLILLLPWLALVLAVACTDDDTFTTSPANHLSFSQDSVSLDTVFSQVPSITKTFWVYNRSGSGIRCASIRLEKGNQTGFRVNVDGSYLGATAGYQMSNLEIRNKDSIRVFVELTSPLANKDVPTRLEDNLLFTLESGVVQKVNLNAFSWDAIKYYNMVVDHDSLISTTRPVIVYGGITVNRGATLTIGAGTTLYFHEDAGIDVHGKLNIQGEADNNVILRGDRLDHMFDYLPYDGVSGQWRGLHFFEESYDNAINYADIHSTYHGVICDSSDVSKLKLSLYNSIVHNCQGYGLKVTHSVVDVVNCQITNALDDCVAVFGGVARLLNCTIAQFYPFDANRGVALRFTNFHEGQTYPLYDFNCINSLVTGYDDDVVMGEADSTANYVFSFDHCILRTPAIEDTVNVRDVVWENIEDTVGCGEKHFKMVDLQKQRYDFRLDSLSTAIGKAAHVEGLTLDRLGVRRDDEPDIGCYEYVKP
ncbi:MAG: right-handed parallel beta-helix repeat-containing protein [Prevotella sp.]|nr:right-handed parallel beta-helix repeat-containing protein [Prevotella sp.]